MNYKSRRETRYYYANALEMHATDLSTSFHFIIKCSVKRFHEFMGC